MRKDLQYKAAVYYVVIFYTLFFYKLYNGLLLCQLQPLFLFARDDIFSFLFLQTGLPHWLLLHPQYFIVFDAVFYFLPLWFLYTVTKRQSGMQVAAFVMLLVNWVYIQCYTLYPTSSVTLYIAWLIFPVVFLVKEEKLFSLLFKGLRYFFLYFFFSAGVWKIVNGGVFNPLQMSAILLDQHKEMLAGSSGWWMKSLIVWQIAHPALSYTLYVLATCMELSFSIGFFTRKYDHLLVLTYIFFLLANHLIMRIPYYETLPFLLTFYLKEVNVSVNKV
jgi:hypothetical protein